MRYNFWVDHNTVSTVQGILQKDNSPETMEELRDWYKQALFCAYCTEDSVIFHRQIAILAEVEQLIS